MVQDFTSQILTTIVLIQKHRKVPYGVIKQLVFISVVFSFFLSSLSIYDAGINRGFLLWSSQMQILKSNLNDIKSVPNKLFVSLLLFINYNNYIIIITVKNLFWP